MPQVLVSQLPFAFTDRSGVFGSATFQSHLSCSSLGFDEGPGGPIYNDRQAMSVHTYCFAQTPDGQPKSKALCHYTDDKYMDVKVFNVITVTAKQHLAPIVLISCCRLQTWSASMLLGS